MTGRPSTSKIVLATAFLIALFLSSGAIIDLGYGWLTAPFDNAASFSAKALSAEEEIRCKSVTHEALIAGAADRYVQAGIAHEIGHQRTASNPWRYTSVSNFLAINPDCCEVLVTVPGDYSPETQSLGAPHSDPPRLYAVRIAFKEWRSDEDTFTRREVVLVNCFGKAGGGVSFDLRRGVL
ncbi:MULTISPECIES: hypothetical protein [unclassified Rhizobium]|uniref:hypothetical protein n=1 Tax=unclassified Rhizobium TaxID=2613769 RepID=UPI001A98B549|nr:MULTISPECIES: hypothetical protein [unclassified Rhizobium]MBX5165249.1 hypothetical protein [Rhizobium sp. NZLR4b]MBX5172678.1 hypothetical protein [Rhizobium sp. NZLR1b]MBX5185083.1 hypothetical protein [Rhizobium sp. NZLR5]MBX5189222.1 hypothetical protein [Rhizobium sp. NZLR3b]MBX5197630.1 hypothetical protein [Rhizobium sp. NZLR10]